MCGNLPQGKETTPAGAKKVGDIYTPRFINIFHRRANQQQELKTMVLTG
jgi:hypothetical protein